MRGHIVACVVLLLFGLSGQALSGVSIVQAERLKQDLTPVGAECEGNASGSIPEWAGGLSEPPVSWRKGEIEVDPFPQDEALFVVTADNMHLYKDCLSDGATPL